MKDEDRQTESGRNNKFEGTGYLLYFLGVMTAIGVVAYGLPMLINHVGGLIAGFVLFMALLGVTFFLITRFKGFFFKKILGLSKADKTIVHNSAKSLLENLISGNLKNAQQDIDPIFEKLSGWYAWISYRNWVITVFYTLFLVFVGLLGSVLIYHQNDLIVQQNTIIARQDSILREQNELVDTQNDLLIKQVNLAEGSRRSSLVFQTNDVVNKFHEELSQASQGGKDCPLSQTLIARISALSQSFRPYRYLNNHNQLTTRPLSPERGQLLMILAKSPLSDACFEEIHQTSTFSFADFFGANLQHSNLANAYLMKASFLGADLHAADLSYADLKRANLTNAYLDHANLTGVKNLTKKQLLSTKSLYGSQGLPDTLLAQLRKEKEALFVKVR